jgi:hypothetical protein
VGIPRPDGGFYIPAVSQGETPARGKIRGNTPRLGGEGDGAFVGEHGRPNAELNEGAGRGFGAEEVQTQKNSQFQGIDGFGIYRVQQAGPDGGAVTRSEGQAAAEGRAFSAVPQDFHQRGDEKIRRGSFAYRLGVNGSGGENCPAKLYYEKKGEVRRKRCGECREGLDKVKTPFIMAWLGLAWLGLAWLGLAWLGLAWLGLAWLGLAWLGRRVFFGAIVTAYSKGKYLSMRKIRGPTDITLSLWYNK